MKKLICLILTLALLLAALGGCSSPAESGDLSTGSSAQSTVSSSEKFSSVRDFYLDESTISAVLIGTQNARKVEPCALGTETCTYKITFFDETALFYNFRISGGESYSLEFLSRRGGDEPHENFEFMPSAADGYTETELSPLKYWELYPDIEKLESPEMLEYSDPFVGDGQLFREKSHALRLAAEVDKLEILPIERFLTEAEKLMRADLSYSLSYYSGPEDGAPAYTVNVGLFSVDTPAETGKMYFAKNYTDFSVGLVDTYFALLAELRAGAEGDEASGLAEKYGIEPCTYDEALAFAETEAALEQAEHLISWAGDIRFETGEQILQRTHRVLWWFANELYRKVGESSVTDDGYFFVVPKAVVDELLFKYFGAETYDPTLSTFYGEEKDSFAIPTAGGGSWIELHFLELDNVSENVVTYKCAFNHGLDDGVPTPYTGIYASFYAMKEDGAPYLRLLSVSGPDEEFSTAEEALAALN